MAKPLEFKGNKTLARSN